MSNDLARTHTPEQTEAVGRLLARTIDDGTDRERWLLARQGLVTATIAKDLLRGGPAARRKAIEDSFVPPSPIIGNRYIDRGNEREPVIAAWVRARYGIAPNIALIAAAENPRHASTPDGIGEIVYRKDDARYSTPKATTTVTRVEVQLAEIKTSKHDLDPALPYFSGTGYFEQMQWQMHTCDAVRTLFVWEQHDDDWEHGPFPIGLEPRAVWIERDDAVIERMIAAADLMLAERDRALAVQAGGEDGDVIDVEILGLALAVLAAREEAKVAEARLKTPWTRMLTLLAEHPEFSIRTGLATVTWTNRVDVVTAPDQDAALAAEWADVPDAHVTGAELLDDVHECERLVEQSAETKALRAAQIVWSEHLSRHTKRTEKPVTKLTVTAPKPAKETNR